MKYAIVLAAFLLTVPLHAEIGKDCVPVSADRIVAADLAEAIPAFADLPQDLFLGYAPRPGTTRIFQPNELVQIAKVHGVDLSLTTPVCAAWPMRRLEPDEVSTAVEKAAQIHGATFEILDYSRPPGRYVVEARDGSSKGTLMVDVGDATPTVAGVPLNAGTLVVRALSQRTGAALSDARITISEAGQGTEGKKDQLGGAPVALFTGGQGSATLAAGRYAVRIELGLVHAERAVVVPAGSQGRLDVPLNGARVLVTALGAEAAGPLELPVLSIVEDDPDAPRGRREVVRSAARQAEFNLPAGTYYVIARLGNIEARELLALAPGDTAQRTLTLSAGRLALSSMLGGGVAPASGEVVSYRIERLDGPDRDVVTTSRANPVLYLPAGRYRVEGRYGVMNARSVAEIEVKAGQLQQVALEHQAGTVKLRLLGAGGAMPDVFWDVFDDAGRSVWTTGQSEPSVILQAGRYAVRAETRDKRYDRQVEVRAGETRLLELKAD